jgi:hypothetical protein
MTQTTAARNPAAIVPLRNIVILLWAQCNRQSKPFDNGKRNQLWRFA